MKLDLVIHGNSNYTGYGIHCRNIIKALTDAGKTVAFVPIQGMEYQIVDSHYIEQCMLKQKYITGREPALMIYHANHMIKFCGSPRMGYAIFESDKIPEHEKVLYETLDCIFVPSEWGRNVLYNNEIEQKRVQISNLHIENTDFNCTLTEEDFSDYIKVIPEGYDPDIFNVTQTPEEIIHRHKRRGYWTFLHVGKWEQRKSSAMIIQAFQVACFQAKIHANLVMKCANPFNTNWQQEFRNIIEMSGSEYADVHIRELGSDMNTEKDMADLYHDADFGLYASKGEAWGLPILESIACGLPTITTNCSGHSEYLREYPISLKVAYDKKEVADDGKFFKGDKGKWYVPDYEDLVERIKWTLENAEYIYNNIRQECVDSIKGYTWANAVKGII